MKTLEKIKKDNLELKKGIVKKSSPISKIKSEGKVREEKFSERLKDREESSAQAEKAQSIVFSGSRNAFLSKSNTVTQLYKQINKPTTSQEKKEEYKKKIIKLEKDLSSIQKNKDEVRKETKWVHEQEKKERFKQKLFGYGSRIETGINVALESATSKLGQALKQRVVSRKILKPNKMEVHIKERVPESNWTDKNIFFKDNYQKEKRSMFLEWCSHVNI